MFVICIADLNIGIDNRYSYVEEQCRGYLTTASPDFCVSVDEEKIRAEYENSTEQTLSSIKDLDGYAESICIYREICRLLPRYDAFLFHSAAVEYKNKAYLFSAPSGTGKTTHIRLWRKNFGKAIDIINGDKPILRKKSDGSFWVYGTPWSGKEGFQENRSAPAAAVCFIGRGEQNSISILAKEKAVDAIFAQVIYPQNAPDVLRFLSLVDRFAETTLFYSLSCNMADEAAFVSFAALTGDKPEDLKKT